NLAQAVLLVAYEWAQAGDETPAYQLVTNATRPATKAELLNFFSHLERALDECGFLRNVEKRPSMVRNIRNLFQRAYLTHQEIRTLHGMVKQLTTLRVPRRSARAGAAARRGRTAAGDGRMGGQASGGLWPAAPTTTAPTSRTISAGMNGFSMQGRLVSARKERTAALSASPVTMMNRLASRGFVSLIRRNRA